MFIVLLDEPLLFVFDDMEHVRREIEWQDADEIRGAFDEYGVPHRVEWKPPPRTVPRLWGLIGWTVPGNFHLVPDGPADPERFRSFLEAHPASDEKDGKAGVIEGILRTLRAS